LFAGVDLPWPDRLLLGVADRVMSAQHALIENEPPAATSAVID
jgi:hypothetical protein